MARSNSISETDAINECSSSHRCAPRVARDFEDEPGIDDGDDLVTPVDELMSR